MYHFQNPGEKIGTISNLDAFLHRSLDTGFKTKWSGLWTPSYKLLDYYAYKVNGLWLDQESLEAVEYGEKICFYFETDSLSIKETVSMPENISGMESKLEIKNKHDSVKAVKIGLEAGVDIREKSNDISESKYSIKRTKNKIEVSQDRELFISSNQELLNSDEPYMKTHYPDEKQECLVPGDISARIEIEPHSTEEVIFNFEAGEASKHEISNKEQLLEGKQDRTFNSSVKSLENLIYDSKGLGVIAGHPWFQSYWARDTFWTLLGLIDAGYFEEAEKILENFAERGLPGKINLACEDEPEGRIDTYPLYIIAADKLRRHNKISSKIEDGMEQAFEELELDENIVVHDSEGTWMDTLERDQAIDVQSLWLEAAEIMDKPEADKLEKGLEKFEEDEYIKDTLTENSPHTINPAVGLMFGQFDEKYLSKINAEFSSRFGARTRSITDPGYDSSGYHTGSSWGLTTCWAAIANFRHGKSIEGLNFLDNLSAFLDEDQPGALPEVVDSENGENLGCMEQAWSAGLFVHAIDTYLLGIKVTEDELVIDPAGDFTGKRSNKRVGDKYIDIKFEHGEPEVLDKSELDRKVITK
ncbi:MAG: amylo-alpha-1,6-glucosidase [Candidatus Nanohaloarchaea archaeon]